MRRFASTSSCLSRRQVLRHAALAGFLPLAGHPLLAQVARAASVGDGADVSTPSGRLVGIRVNGVRVFRGVPFAQPPTGDLRFRPAQPVKPWTGTRDATRFAAAAPQPGDRTVPQDEDCLYLNVWTPDDAPTKPANLPVFVWIHGGGFTGGESFAKLFDGTVFARQGVVVVTVAYRLGVLGFLDLQALLGPAFAGSANNALTDLIAALGWVQNNIASFGGDPQRVTLGGESAGAKLTDLLMAVPSAKPLFSAMISESGGAERIWPKEAASRVAQGFGKLWTATMGQPISALQRAPARQLIDVQTAFLKSWPQHFPLRCELDGNLFPDLPLATIAGGSARGKRLLIGTNRDESALFLGPHPQHDPTAADLGNMALAEFDGIYAQYATVYPDMTAEQRRIRATTAEEYWAPSIHVANAAAGGGAHVWAYELTLPRASGPEKGLSPHTEDLGLVWDQPGENPIEGRLATQVNAAWAAFLQGQPPAAPGLPAWPEYDAGQRPTMMLDAPSRVEVRPQQAELQLWRSFTK